MSEARKRAEEAMAEFKHPNPAANLYGLTTRLAEALRSLLAEEPGAPKATHDLPSRRPDVPMPASWSEPVLPPEVREAAERHRSTLLSGLAYVARESWWPDDASVTDGVRNHVAKMRDAADALTLLAARRGDA